MAHALIVLASLFVVGSARLVTLSNTQLPLDAAGQLLLTGELTVVSWNNSFWVYLNNWGGCPGVDCCTSASGCASCCFNPPSPRYPDACVYTANHSVVAYRTDDFATYEPLGVVLPLSARRAGVEFRPQVIFHAPSASFIMWYEDRWTGGQNRGYAVARSSSPAGPFVTVSDSVVFGGAGRVGDYDVFVDDDGAAYHVRTGITIERLAANYTAPGGGAVDLPNGGVEGPSMFKRGSIYYLLVGVGCCACLGGSNIVYYTAPSPLGPFTLRGDVGSNKTAGHVFDAHSPFNYVTRAQGSKVIRVPAADGSEQYLWIGNAWVSSTQPGNPRNHDLLYFTLLDFDAAGNILQVVRSDTCTISVP